jgi:hypothetical protein
VEPYKSIYSGWIDNTSVRAVLFGKLQRDGFFDRERKAEQFLSFVLERKGVDTKRKEGSGGAGSNQSADGSDQHGSFRSF